MTKEWHVRVNADMQIDTLLLIVRSQVVQVYIFLNPVEFLMYLFGCNRIYAEFIYRNRINENWLRLN